MATCIVDNCKFDVFEDKEQCALHCDKALYNLKSSETLLFRLFKKNLCVYLADAIRSDFQDLVGKPLSTLENFLMTGRDDLSKRYSGFLRDQEITISGVIFPDRKKSSHYDYFRLLQKFKSIHFQDCSFYTTTINLHEKEVFFDACTFNVIHYVSSDLVLENIDNVLYSSCVFEKDITTSYVANGKVACVLFSDCEFREALDLDRTIFEKEVFSDSKIPASILHELRIVNCVFNDRFTLNYREIASLDIQDSEFNKKVELKSNCIEKCQIENTNFHDLVDAYRSEFILFSARKSIFKEIATFEECVFGSNEDEGLQREGVATFNHVTFLDFTNFRDTIFYYGLDIRNTNLKESPNFLDVNVNFKNTNRETFRIIKHSFDRLGNNLEANRFYAMEMEKYKEEIKRSGAMRERFIFWVNKISSNFGQNYVLPMYWIAAASLIYYILVKAKDKNWLYKLLPVGGDQVNSVFQFINDVSAHFIPFKKFLEPGMELLSLFAYVIFAGLIWQTLVAMKRHTRR